MGDTVVIIGGNGKTGGRVAAGLAERGMAARFVSRSTLVPFDWENPESWAPALNGADRAYVTFQPDLAVEGADAAIDRLARLAREAGLKQMVLLSGRGEPGAQRAEAALQIGAALERRAGKLVQSELFRRLSAGQYPVRRTGPARRPGTRTLYRCR